MLAEATGERVDSIMEWPIELVAQFMELRAYRNRLQDAQLNSKYGNEKLPFAMPGGR
jgi:hypothetical protein